MRTAEDVLKGVTVVDKITLPEVDLKKQRFESVKKASTHFRERLLERYGISITLHQFLMINKKNHWDKEDKIFILIIKNIPVRVVQRGGVLVTALPLLNR